MSIFHQTALQARFGGIRDFERGCRGKVQFEDGRAAKDAARAMHKKVHRQFSAYHCAYCDSWHIGGRRKDLEVISER